MLQRTIALVYDFDLTLTPDYMQKPIFERFGVDESKFWGRVRDKKKEMGARGTPFQEDAMYLDLILREAQPGGQFDGLTEEMFRELGSEILLFSGLPDFFLAMSAIVKEPRYSNHDIKVEHHIASTGIFPMLVGSAINDYMDSIDASDFLYDDNGRPDGIAKVLTPTEKTGTLFRINKGTHRTGVGVNDTMDPEKRPVPFSNMIYFGDGPSDVPPMSLLEKNKGHTIAVYGFETGDKDIEKVMRNANLLKDGRRAIDTAPADYSPGSHLHNVSTMLVHKIADGIVAKAERFFLEGTSASPAHQNE